MKEHHSFPDYTPAPSIGHELGVMFGFMVFCLLFVGVYWFIWTIAQRRASRKEGARRESLSARGINEKGVDQNGNQVHGMMVDSPDINNPAAAQGQDGLGIGMTGFGRVSPHMQQQQMNKV